MYSIIFTLCLALNFTVNFGSYMHASLDNPVPTASSSKKKIIIFTFNKGGYGHKAACKSLNELFAQDYAITIIDIAEYLGVGKCLGGFEIYDQALRGGWTNLTNFAAGYCFPTYLKVFQRTFQKRVKQLLEKEKPDLAISVVMYLDGVLAYACKELDIPFLLVTTDGDLQNWVIGLNPEKYTNMKVTIGFKSPKTQGVLRKTGISPQDILFTGFPIRKDFLEKKDKRTIQQAWNLPEHKFIVMVLMGGVGAAATYSYVKKLSKMNLPIHLVVCAGSNKKMLQKIKALEAKSNVSMTIVPFTQRVSDLMAASDVLITKAGPGSINEAMFMDLPMLIDKTSPVLYWEEENIRFVENNGFGLAVTSFVSLEKTLTRLLQDKSFYQQFKQKLTSYTKPNFDQSITQVVHQLCPGVPVAA